MLPFTLSFESKNPKLVQIAIGCIQRLISHQAIPEVLNDDSISSWDWIGKIII